MKNDKHVKETLFYSLIATLILSLCFMFTTTTAASTSIVSNQTASPASNVIVFQKTFKYSDLKYPQIKGLQNKTAEANINQILLTNVKNSYKLYVQMLKDEKENQNNDFCKKSPQSCDYSYGTFYTLKYKHGHILSILITDYGYYGGAHGTSLVKSYNFNLKTGQQIKINHVLKTKAKMGKTQRYAYNYIQKHKELFFPEIKLSDVKIDYFYFTKNGIVVIFQEYEVAAYAAGQPTIKIPSSVYK
jgi:hypothetical protein